MKLMLRILSLLTLSAALVETLIWLLRWVFEKRVSLPAPVVKGTSAILYVSGASRYWPSTIERNEEAFLRELEARAPAGCRVIYDVFPFIGKGTTPRGSRSPLWWMCLRNIVQGALYLPRFLRAKAAERIVAAVGRDGPERVLIIANSLGATIAAGAASRLNMRTISLGGVYLWTSDKNTEAIVGERDWIGRLGKILFRGPVTYVPRAGHMDYFGPGYAATLDAVLNSRGWKWLQS